MAITVGTNSYISEADAATYIELMGLTSLSNPEQLLKQATIALDRLYGGRYIGTKVDSTQALQWPRWVSNVASNPEYRRGDLTSAVFELGYAIDSDGNYRDFGIIPPEIGQATVELAVMLDSGVNLYAQPDAVVTEVSEQVDVIKTSAKYATGLQTKPLYAIDIILRPLLAPANQVRLVRG